MSGSIIDARIPMAGGYGPDIGAAISQGLKNANDLSQLQQVQQQIKRQNQLRGILGAPGAVDPATGMPTTDTIGKVMSVDPATGIKLGENSVMTQQRQLQMQGMRAKATQEQTQLMNDAFAPIVIEHEQAIKDGKITPQQADAASQKAWTEAREGLAKSGAVPPEMMQNIPTQWSYPDAKRRAMASQVAQDAWKRQDAERKEAQTEKHQTNQEQIERERNERMATHDDMTNRRAGATPGLDKEGNAIFFYPNETPDKRAQYQDGRTVPPEMLSGAHKMGSGAASNAAALDQERIKRATTFKYEQKIGHPVSTPAEQAALDQLVLDAETKQKQANRGTSAAAADQEAIRQRARYDYEHNVLGHTVDPNNQEEVDGLNKAYLDAEDKRKVTSAGDIAVARDAAKHIPDDVSRNIAEQYVETGNPMVLAGFRRSPAMIAQIEGDILKAQKERGMSPRDVARQSADFSAYTQGVKAFEAGGRLEPVVRAQNVAVQHLAVLQTAAEALKNKNFTAFNGLKNKVSELTGQEAPTDFNGVKRIVGTELVKAITGSAGALGDREALDADLKVTNSEQQLIGLIGKYKQLMAGQLSGLRQSYDRLGTGHSFDERFLAPETQHEVAIYAPKAGSGGQAAPPTQVPTITHDEAGKKAYEALPPGAEFVSNGTTYRKPGQAGPRATPAPPAPVGTNANAPVQIPPPASTAPPPPTAPAPSPVARGTSAAPLPLTQGMKPADLVDGGIYATGRGPARWDAAQKKFFPVGSQ